MANGAIDQQAIVAEATALLRQGALADAVQRLQAWVDLHPDDAQCLAMLGKAQFKNKDFADAAQSFARAFALTGDGLMMNWQGLALRKLGNPTEAEACYRQAMALLPNDPVPKVNLAILVADTSPKKALALLTDYYYENPSPAFLLQIVLLCWGEKDYLNAGVALAKISQDERAPLKLTPEQALAIFHNGALTAWERKYCVESLVLRREAWNLLPIMWELSNPREDCPDPVPELKYSRENPSPRYRILSEQYGMMHTSAAQAVGQVGDFAGTRMNFIYAPLIKDFLQAHEVTSLLDYGGGRGLQYQPMEQPGGSVFPGLASYYRVETARSFDAGWPVECPYPAGEKFDAVVSCDVLEHIDQDDLPWVVDELFAFARKAIFVAIGSYPAAKTLPNGENAHCTIKPSSWWRPIFAAAARRHPGIRYRVLNVLASNAAEFDGFEGIG